MSYTVVTQINAIQTIEVTTNPYLLQMIFINARNGITLQRQSSLLGIVADDLHLLVTDIDPVIMGTYPEFT